MENYLNNSGNSPITHYKIGNDYVIVRFNGGKDYSYSYLGKAGKSNVETMKILAVNGSGLSAYITKNVRFLYD